MIVNKIERWPSGLRRTLGKRVYVNSVSRVRIPSPPPFPRIFSVLISADRIMFSVDYPYVENTEGTEWMETLPYQHRI